ncbi:hypothetical protein EK904_007590 [Melospiza melodia maxima]|nr:hypothetical protein EK904_007590 [Melospiza melodia maxima]
MKKGLFTYHIMGSMARAAVLVYSIITGFAFNDLARCGHGHRSNTLAAADSVPALVSNGVRDEWATRDWVGRSSGAKSCHQTKLMEGLVLDKADRA